MERFRAHVSHSQSPEEGDVLARRYSRRNGYGAEISSDLINELVAVLPLIRKVDAAMGPCVRITSNAAFKIEFPCT